jgi:hypothetical protein
VPDNLIRILLDSRSLREKCPRPVDTDKHSLRITNLVQIYKFYE